jgi:hypothetical protein
MEFTGETTRATRSKHYNRMFASVALLSNFFYFTLMPETKDKSMLEIKKMFSKTNMRFVQGTINIVVP